MMFKKFLVVVLSVLALAGFGLWLYISSNNPESLSLNEETRALAPGQFIELGDGLTHYDIAGPEDGQVVVLVHGFSVPFYIWNTTFAALSNAGFRVVRFDTYGRGYSDRPDTRYDGALFERQINDLIDGLGLQAPVDLVGLSMGGAVAARYAARNPERVRRVVFVDPTHESWGEPPFPRPVGDIVLALRLFPVIAEGQMSDFLYPENYPDWVERYRTQMQYEGFRNAIVSTIYDFGPEDHLAHFARLQEHDKELLLIWGEQDQIVPISGAQTVQGVLDVEYFPVADSGHLPHIEKAAQTNAKILEFLSNQHIPQIN